MGVMQEEQENRGERRTAWRSLEEQEKSAEKIGRRLVRVTRVLSLVPSGEQRLHTVSNKR